MRSGASVQAARIVCLLLAGTLEMATPGAATPADCPPVAETVDDDATLTQTRDALLAGGEVEVLALGTTLNAAPEPLATFSAEIATTLPRVTLRISRAGEHGTSASDLLALLRTELPRKPYRLVLWQTGTFEAARNLNPGEFHDALEEGAGLVRDAGAGLILIDPQFSHFLQANADVTTYLETMRLIAALPEVALFPRFDLTRDWANDDGIDAERASRADRPALVARLQRCVGTALARATLRLTVGEPTK